MWCENTYCDLSQLPVRSYEGHPDIWVTHYTGGSTQRGGTLHPGVREDTPHRVRSKRRGQWGYSRGAANNSSRGYNLHCRETDCQWLLTVSGYQAAGLGTLRRQEWTRNRRGVFKLRE